MSEKKKWRRLTQVGLLIFIFVAIIWDVIVAITPEGSDTISESARDYAIYPILPTMIGGLGGHFFFWEVRVVPDPWGMIAALSVFVAVAVWSVLVKNHTGPQWLESLHTLCSRHPIVVFGVATLLGGMFWGLEPSAKTL
jgi:hypothetical protein